MAEREGLIAVTGASGFVGAHLCRQLESARLPVIGITRDGAGGTRCLGDLAGAPDWQECLKGVNTVVHCAALAHQPLTDDKQQRVLIYRVNHQAVVELAQNCVAAGVKRLVFLSTVKVYGESSSGRPPFSEDDVLAPEDDYGRSKMLAEAALAEFSNHDLEIVVLRLPLVYGPGVKANFRKLQQLALSGLPLPLGSIRNRRSILSIHNLNKVVIALLMRSSWPVRVLNVADPEPVSVSNLVRWLALSGGSRARLLPVPVWFLRSMAALLRRPGLVERLAGDLEVSTDRLAELLPEVDLRPAEEMVLECTINELN